MCLTTQGSSQLQSIFGSGYVAEQSGDEMYRNLPPSENRHLADLSEILKLLRAALSASVGRAVTVVRGAQRLSNDPRPQDP